ncbi:MAG: hypothetical protein DRO73_01135 [Candidatus Thorarchaeota archaeon]|nr:MAG: hypothetical protein DRO73_01135 [Candidatus Thorarchaeota archaeon]
MRLSVFLPHHADPASDVVYSLLSRLLVDNLVFKRHSNVHVDNPDTGIGNPLEDLKSIVYGEGATQLAAVTLVFFRAAPNTLNHDDLLDRSAV